MHWGRSSEKNQRPVALRTLRRTHSPGHHPCAAAGSQTRTQAQTCTIICLRTHMNTHLICTPARMSAHTHIRAHTCAHMRMRGATLAHSHVFCTDALSLSHLVCCTHVQKCMPHCWDSVKRKFCHTHHQHTHGAHHQHPMARIIHTPMASITNTPMARITNTPWRASSTHPWRASLTRPWHALIHL